MKFLLILKDDEIHTPASIVRHGERQGLIDSSQPKNTLSLERRRIRHSLGGFSRNHYFPKAGDGWVAIQGQAPSCGWFGWRWKKALKQKH